MDGKLLAHHVAERYGVPLGARQCQRLFHQLGFRRRKSRPVIAQADPVAQAAFKKLRRLARDPAVDLWSVDECHFQQHGTRCVMWVPPEDIDPILLHAPTRNTVALFGAVQPSSGRLVTCLAPRFNADTFEPFLRHLLRHRARGRRLVAIVDSASYHYARALDPFLASHREVLRLLFLPPYSPELNPIERVWKLTRRLCTHNRYFPTLEELVAAVVDHVQAWRSPNPVLRRLCGII